MRYCRRLISRVSLVVIGREDLCKSISNLDTPVEAHFLINGAVEGHKEARVVVVVLRDRGVIEVVETCFYGFERMSSRIKPALCVSESESLRLSLATLLAPVCLHPLHQMIKNL